MPSVFVPTINTVSVVREGTRVVVVVNGVVAINAPYEAVREIARAMLEQCARADDEVHAVALIADQALLMRSGATLALTGNADILSEAEREAHTNANLKRYLPGVVGIPSAEQLGVPALRKHKPKR